MFKPWSDECGMCHFYFIISTAVYHGAKLDRSLMPQRPDS